MAKATIYHNPNCSKSRQALRLLQGKNLDIDIIEYLKTPLSKNTLKNILKLLVMTPQCLLRRNEQIYKKLKLSDETISHDNLLDIMVNNPILIERPIVIIGNRAILARPPELLLSLITLT